MIVALVLCCTFPNRPVFQSQSRPVALRRSFGEDRLLVPHGFVRLAAVGNLSCTFRSDEHGALLFDQSTFVAAKEIAALYNLSLVLLLELNHHL